MDLKNEIEKLAEEYWATHAQDGSTKDAFRSGVQAVLDLLAKRAGEFDEESFIKWFTGPKDILHVYAVNAARWQHQRTSLAYEALLAQKDQRIKELEYKIEGLCFDFEHSRGGF